MGESLLASKIKAKPERGKAQDGDRGVRLLAVFPYPLLVPETGGKFLRRLPTFITLPELSVKAGFKLPTHTNELNMEELRLQEAH